MSSLNKLMILSILVLLALSCKLIKAEDEAADKDRNSNHNLIPTKQELKERLLKYLYNTELEQLENGSDENSSADAEPLALDKKMTYRYGKRMTYRYGKRGAMPYRFGKRNYQDMVEHLKNADEDIQNDKRMTYRYGK